MVARSCEKGEMATGGANKKRRGPVALAELVGRAIDPVTAKRGFATVELIAAWSDIVGAGFAECSQPDKVVWPRGSANDGVPGTLIVRVEGPRALLLQHEADQIVERANAFLGHGAIGKVKIVQGAVRPRPKAATKAPTTLDERDEANLSAAVAAVDSSDLRQSLARLGRAVLGERDKKT